MADDEVAIGALMLGMADYVEGGVPPYPLAEACQDHYLSITCAQALKEGPLAAHGTTAVGRIGLDELVAQGPRLALY